MGISPRPPPAAGIQPSYRRMEVYDVAMARILYNRQRENDRKQSVSIVGEVACGDFPLLTQ